MMLVDSAGNAILAANRPTAVDLGTFDSRDEAGEALSTLSEALGVLTSADRRLARAVVYALIPAARGRSAVNLAYMIHEPG